MAEPKADKTAVLWGQFRHVLTGIGGFFVARGVVDSDSVGAALTHMDTIVASVLYLIGAVGSWMNKRNSESGDGAGTKG